MDDSHGTRTIPRDLTGTTMVLDAAPAPANDVGRDWRLAAVVDNERGFPHVHVISSVSVSDAARLQVAMGEVRDFESRHYVYLVWRANYDELSRFWRRIVVDYGSGRGFDGRVGTRLSLELKRLLMNYLSSARAFVAHTARRLKRDERNGRDIEGWHAFEAWREASEPRFEYAFLFDLRNYFQHAGLPRFTLKFSQWHTAGDNAGHFTIATLTVDRDALLNDYTEWRRVERQLRAQPADIDLLAHVDRHAQQLNQLANVCADASLRVAREPLTHVQQRWREVQTAVPNSRPALVRYEQRTADHWSLTMTWFPDDAMELAGMLAIARGFVARAPRDGTR
jgi:hypothetical protein